MAVQHRMQSVYAYYKLNDYQKVDLVEQLKIVNKLMISFIDNKN